MTFRILDYVEITSEIKTEYTAKCPSCGGKLKIKKDNQAYCCVSDQCSVEEIRSFIGKPIRKTFKPYQPEFQYLTPKLLSQGKLQALGNKEKQDLGQTYIESTTYAKITHYYYSKLVKVKRFDFTQDPNKKKVFYPYFRLNEESSWLQSTKTPHDHIEKCTCFYKQDYINSKCIMLVVEGEKCCDFIIENLGILATTPMGSKSDEATIYRLLKKVYPSGILIIPDNDKVGYKKAHKIQRIAWQLLIPCSIKPFPRLFSNGKDVADLNSDELEKFKGGLSKWI